VGRHAVGGRVAVDEQRQLGSAASASTSATTSSSIAVMNPESRDGASVSLTWPSLVNWSLKAARRMRKVGRDL
jgi:hypothetical protein